MTELHEDFIMPEWFGTINPGDINTIKTYLSAMQSSQNKITRYLMDFENVYSNLGDISLEIIKSMKK